MGNWVIPYLPDSTHLTHSTDLPDSTYLTHSTDSIELTLSKVGNLRKGELAARLKNHVEQAEKLVQQTGYHRRDPEVALGYSALFLAQGDLGKAREHLARAKALLEKMGIREWDFEVRWLEWVIGNR